MTIHEVDPFDELFTHVADDGGKQTTYNVTRLYQHIMAHTDEVDRVTVPVDAEHAEYCVQRRGVEVDRLQVLAAHPEYLKKPVLFLKMPDDEHLLLDGTHRYVVFYTFKAPSIPAFIVPYAMAVPFIVTDMPDTDEAMLMAWSGLTLARQLQQAQEKEKKDA